MKFDPAVVRAFEALEEEFQEVAERFRDEREVGRLPDCFEGVVGICKGACLGRNGIGIRNIDRDERWRNVKKCSPFRAASPVRGCRFLFFEEFHHFLEWNESIRFDI
jgi:hypothetical protein